MWLRDNLAIYRAEYTLQSTSWNNFLMSRSKQTLLGYLKIQSQKQSKLPKYAKNFVWCNKICTVGPELGGHPQGMVRWLLNFRFQRLGIIQKTINNTTPLYAIIDPLMFRISLKNTTYFDFVGT